MKSFLRAAGASLLCICLLVFGLWRYDAFPDLSGFTAWLQEFKEQTGELIEATDDLINGVTGDGNDKTPAKPVESGNEYTGYTPTEEIETDLLTVIRGAYDDHLESVDISAFELTSEELKTVVSGVRYSCPEYFYVANTYTYSSNTQSGLVTEFHPAYLVDAETAAAQTETYEQTIAEIVAGAPDGSDFDKVLYLHDYFVQNYCYDYTYTIRDAYTFFEQGTGVCQAYMLAFIAVAEAMDIRSIPVTSTEMNHAWNLVEVDGVWYHMDITWDDTGSYPSFTSYAYFLQSDSGIHNYDVARTDDLSKIHHDWTCSQTASDARYDSAIWRETIAPVTVADGKYYCIVAEAEGKGGFLFSGEDPLEMAEVLDIDGIWKVGNTNSYYPGCYSGLMTIGNDVVYNTDKILRAYNVVTKKDRLLLLPTLGQAERIYGFYDPDPADGKISLVVAEKPNSETYRLIEFSIS